MEGLLIAMTMTVIAIKVRENHPVLHTITETERRGFQTQENQCCNFKKIGKAEDLLTTYKLLISFYTL